MIPAVINHTRLVRFTNAAIPAIEEGKLAFAASSSPVIPPACPVSAAAPEFSTGATRTLTTAGADTGATGARSPE
jgi:hypothetical protein